MAKTLRLKPSESRTEHAPRPSQMRTTSHALPPGFRIGLGTSTAHASAASRFSETQRLRTGSYRLRRVRGATLFDDAGDVVILVTRQPRHQNPTSPRAQYLLWSRFVTLFPRAPSTSADSWGWICGCLGSRGRGPAPVSYLAPPFVVVAAWVTTSTRVRSLSAFRASVSPPPRASLFFSPGSVYVVFAAGDEITARPLSSISRLVYFNCRRGRLVLVAARNAISARSLVAAL